MQLSAALLPPPEAATDLARFVAGVPGVREGLELVPAGALQLRLANFGNVTRADAGNVKRALEVILAHHDPVRLRFARGVALEPVGDDSVWAQLEGDADAVSRMGRAVVDEALRIGFAIDRRLSRRLVRVARVGDRTTVEQVQAALDALTSYAGPWWTCGQVSLLGPPDRTGGEGFEVWDTVRVGG